MGNYQTLLLLGLLFHISFIYSVFDCYFTSPVVHGMQRFSLASQAPAKRLVLIVGDGLRADLLFEKNGFPRNVDAPEVVAPHLRSIVEERGAFGVSHTRVPTESRPGHVAIIAGMYEDVSAVTKGWKTNPVDFDSVFNQSSHTYSFGSPDILPMFARGAVEGKVLEWTYHEDGEDFTKDATALDTWVLDQLRTLLRNASDTSNPHSAQLSHDLHQPQTIFFLHLLGLDTTGHSYRPFSQEYMRNIQVVDDIVKDVEVLMKDFYGEEETAYVFTADHGMSLIGNHGDGHPDNTRTPVVVWGKGLRGPLPDPSSSTHDEYSAPWELGHLYRQDLSQADLAPLMSTLLGLEWPVNSVGVLPGIQASTKGFLDLSDEEMARAAEVNAKMILEHYCVKHELKRSKKFIYKPFLPLEEITTAASSPSQDNTDTPSSSPIPIPIPNHQHHLSVIKDAISSGSFAYAREQAYNLIQLGLEGLRYVETYDRTLIRGIVVAAYLGWATYAALRIGVFGGTFGGSLTQTKTISKLIAFGVFAAFCAMFYLEHAPWTYYIYIGWPVWFWGEVVGEVLPLILTSVKREGKGSDKPGMGALLLSVLGVAGLEVGALGCMVIGYTHRIVWSLGFVLMGVVWPLGFWPSSDNKSKSKDAVQLGKLRWLWMGSSIANAVFPLLNVNKEERLEVIISAGFLMLAIGGSYTWQLSKRRKEEERALVVQFCVQLLLIVLMMLATRGSALSLQAKQGLPLVWQSLGWIVILLSPALAFGSPISHLPHSPGYNRVVKSEKGNDQGDQRLFHPNPITSRFMQYTLGLGPLFIILSISDEALFFVCYSVEMWAWVRVEGALGRIKDSQRQNGAGKSQKDASNTQAAYQFTLSSLRIALFFLFFVQAAFFGTGNVASISSFYLSPVYRLIPVFNPFFMAVPLICKIISPYVLLSIAVASLTYALELPQFSLFLLALTITDGMTLVFFFMVRDTGSWLEIGQTISFFIITNLLTLWSGGVCAVGEFLMRNVLVRRSGNERKVKVN
ncbi:hypothetical protein D9758_009433 [Tetrapyrgos nigripes]|uniref:GPI ethanolamine phosphate transferase 1 n=1 Tax=Tetrapyrgos nigripes TaxID=182062 RepID=A0A8H5FX85_9AGAR|nr:hypothetical protein D9758_009433 [Tetrapyrgos nigripes]